jgi:hypothetical protein
MTDLIPSDGVIRFDGTYSWDTCASRVKEKVKHGTRVALRTPHTTPVGCVQLDCMKSHRQLRNFVVLERGKEENQLINVRCTI